MEIKLEQNDIICENLDGIKIEINLEAKKIVGIEEFFKKLVIRREMDFTEEVVFVSDECKKFLKEEVSEDVLELFEKIIIEVNKA